MKCKSCFQVKSQTTKISFALLTFRIIMGTAFFLHGSGKMQNPMGWMGPDATVPGFLQGLAALSEFGGGIALILGFLTPLASLGIFCTMTVAFCLHRFVMKDPFVNMTGGSSYELALVYWGACLIWLNIGPGKYSADAKVFGIK